MARFSSSNRALGALLAFRCTFFLFLARPVVSGSFSIALVDSLLLFHVSPPASCYHAHAVEWELESVSKIAFVPSCSSHNRPPQPSSSSSSRTFTPFNSFIQFAARSTQLTRKSTVYLLLLLLLLSKPQSIISPEFFAICRSTARYPVSSLHMPFFFSFFLSQSIDSHFNPLSHTFAVSKEEPIRTSSSLSRTMLNDN